MSFTIFIAVLVAGLIIGSFLNSVIYRMSDLVTIFSHRSHCPHCKREILWYDLVPLFSFVVLEGKCRFCKRPISLQYPIVEFATSLLFILLYLGFGITFYSIMLAIISAFLVIIFVYDLYFKIIPNIIVIPAIVVWAAAWILMLVPGANLSIPNDFHNLIYGGLISGLFIGAIVFFTRGKGMGVGDIKLAFLLGFILGWANALVFLFFAFLLGAIVGVALILTHVKKLKSQIPFGPFLIAGFYLALFFGEKIISWYIK